MSNDLVGTTALITGGSRGIGLGVAQSLHSRGATVVMTGRSRGDLDSAVSMFGDRSLGVAGDAMDVQHQADAVDAAMGISGRIDMLVNNVGTHPAMQPLIDVDPDLLVATMQTNVASHLSWTQAVWRASMREHGGSVVNISSMAGLPHGIVNGGSVYTVSKAAIIQLTRQLALELAPGVRVNAVAPGLTRTSRTSAMLDADEAQWSASIPLARVGESHDIGEAVAFLLSDQSSWITGETILVDGGRLLNRG